MVAIVLVSHSPKLAQGLAELVAQIGSEDVPVTVVAGGPGGELGTSVNAVVEAVESADRGEGVVILPDLGSAVLAVRSALDGSRDPRKILVDAPFVEGAVAAAVTAASGAPLEVVAAAAGEARNVRKV